MSSRKDERISLEQFTFLREFLPPFMFLQLDFCDPPIEPNPSDLLFYPHRKEAYSPLTPEAILHSMYTILFNYGSPLHDKFHYYQIERDIYYTYFRSFDYDEYDHVLCQGTNPSSKMPRRQSQIAQAIIASNLARSFPIDYAVPPSPIAITFDGVSLSIHPDGMFTLSIRSALRNVDTFHLDILALLSFFTESKSFLPDLHPTFPSSGIVPREFELLLSTFLAIWPMLTPDENFLSPQHLIFSKFNAVIYAQPNDISRIPVTLYNLAIQNHLPVIPTIQILNNVPVQTSQFATITYHPVILNRNSDIIFVELNFNITQLANALRTSPFANSLTSIDAVTFRSRIPMEIYEMILSYFLYQIWQSCKCTHRSTPRGRYLMNSVERAAFVLTPLGTTERIDTLSHDRIITHLLHIETEHCDYYRPTVPTYQEAHTCDITSVFRCPCHLKFPIYDFFLDDLTEVPQPMRRLVAHFSQHERTNIHLACKC
jgi:hypothetical protein